MFWNKEQAKFRNKSRSRNLTPKVLVLNWKYKKLKRKPKKLKKVVKYKRQWRHRVFEIDN